jgi:PAS domain S-box-containing protein
MTEGVTPLSLFQIPIACFGTLSVIISVVAVLASIAAIGKLIHSWVRNWIFSGRYLNTNQYSTSRLFKLLEKNLAAERTSHGHLIKAIYSIANQTETSADLQLDNESKEAIQKLQSKLAAVKEEENERLWAAQGVANMSDIRDNNASIDDYTFQIIRHLVQYLEANQAAFFILNDSNPDKPCLECTATFAYGRRKYTHEKITLELGTGLLGQCALEGSMTLLTDVPGDYIKITSGLGESLPRFIAMIPLRFRNETLGVIEIASFNALKQYQIDFLKKASDSIALELSVIKTNERKHKALEQSREAELRQSLEEMRAAQKEMLLKEEQLSQQLANTKRAMAMADAERRKNEAILEGCMDAVVCFNHKGAIEYFNRAAEEIFGVSRESIFNRNIRQILEINITTDQSGQLKLITNKGNEVSLRTELNAIDAKGEDVSLLLTVTKVNIDGEYLFTVFAQKVSVELF